MYIRSWPPWLRIISLSPGEKLAVSAYINPNSWMTPLTGPNQIKFRPALKEKGNVWYQLSVSTVFVHWISRLANICIRPAVSVSGCKEKRILTGSRGADVVELPQTEPQAEILRKGRCTEDDVFFSPSNTPLFLFPSISIRSQDERSDLWASSAAIYVCVSQVEEQGLSLPFLLLWTLGRLSVTNAKSPVLNHQPAKLN